MPFYDLVCRNSHKHEVFLTYGQYDDNCFGKCGVCRALLFPSAANNVCVYGMDKYSGQSFKDASEASGKRITNTRQIDALEKQGVMYAVTNPSRYKFRNGAKQSKKDFRKKISELL